MNSGQPESRMKKLSASVADAGFNVATNELGSMVSDGVRWFMQAVRQQIVKFYSEKVSPTPEGAATLAELESGIARSSEQIEIGVRKEELAVIWAMRRLGYTDEESCRVIEEARKAYGNEENSDEGLRTELKP